MSTFKNSTKLRMSTPVILRFILTGRKIMTGLDVDLLSEIELPGASKLASAYFTLFYRSVHVLYTGIY